jgi:UPF0716 protein FxsA
MALVKSVLIGLLVLPAAEIATFLLVVALIGWLAAATLFVVTSVAGVALLRRSARSDLDRLRVAIATDGLRAVHLETPGMAAMLAGILLVLPGFITDIVGAALLLPAFRRWASGRFARAAERRRTARRGERVIDLHPNEWQRLPDRRRRSRKSDPGSRQPS